MYKDNNLQFLDTNEERNIPANLEAISKSEKTTEHVKETLHNCAERNQLTDTFTINHLLSKLSSNKVAVLSCLSPVDKIGLPYYVKYLKPSLLVDKDYLCISLCNGIHFQGYVINMKERKVVQKFFLTVIMYHPNLLSSNVCSLILTAAEFGWFQKWYPMYFD